MAEKKPSHPDETAFGKRHKERQANRGVRVVTVPEWGTPKTPLKLYAYPLTINDVIHLDGKYASQAEQNIMQIIRQCMDAQGEPYFSLNDKAALMNEPADIIGKVLIALNGEASSFNKELKKNK
jgi:hypothetical protein